MQAIVQGDGQTTEVMARLPYFQGLAEADLENLAQGSCQVDVGKGELLYRKGDPVEHVSIIVAGQFKVVLPLPDGEEKVLAFARRGDSFGEAAVLSGAPSPISVVAMEDSHILAVERAAFLNDIASNPRLAVRILQSVSHRLVALLQGLEMCHMRSSMDRVICYLNDRTRQTAAASLEFELPARKGDIAARLSMAPATLSRALSDLEAQGVIHLRGRHVRVLDPARLVSLRRNQG
jgi:CRP/FNR family transcriptional regulator, dissimilatory nitrate respiration regulator